MHRSKCFVARAVCPGPFSCLVSQRAVGARGPIETANPSAIEPTIVRVPTGRRKLRSDLNPSQSWKRLASIVMEARTVTASAPPCPCAFAVVPTQTRHLLPLRCPSQQLVRSILAHSTAVTTLSCRPLSASQPAPTGVPCQHPPRRRVLRASGAASNSRTSSFC